MEYLLLKWLHILSATFLFGTGVGSAFYKFMADRSGNLPAIVQTNRHVVLADWWFTTPTIIIQPVSGVLLTQVLGYPLSSPWLLVSIGLYIFMGLCWLPVVFLQIRMSRISTEALAKNVPLGTDYQRLAKRWFWLGVPAFVAMVAVYYLMVFKPLLWN